LGLPAQEIILLALSAIVGTLTLRGSRAPVLQGTVHLALFAVCLFLAIVP
jgi:Ca2+:H+ antiporter